MKKITLISLLLSQFTAQDSTVVVAQPDSLLLLYGFLQATIGIGIVYFIVATLGKASRALATQLIERNSSK